MSALDTPPPCNSHVCPHRMAFVLDNWVRKMVQNPGRIVGEYIKQGDTVVDIGCGPGFFATEMARMVGKHGRVVAVDLQEEMLNRARKKAAANNVAGQMTYHCCSAGGIGLHLENKADFILAYYVVHEIADPHAFFTESRELLKENGRLLVVEPRFHVSKARFSETINLAQAAGFKAVDRPRRKGGRSTLLELRR